MPGVAIGDERDRHPSRDPTHALGHLARRHEPEIGKAVGAGRHPEAAEKEELGPRLLDDAGGEGIMGHKRPQEPGTGEERPEAGGGRHRAPSPSRQAFSTSRSIVASWKIGKVS